MCSPLDLRPSALSGLYLVADGLQLHHGVESRCERAYDVLQPLIGKDLPGSAPDLARTPIDREQAVREEGADADIAIALNHQAMDTGRHIEDG